MTELKKTVQTNNVARADELLRRPLFIIATMAIVALLTIQPFAATAFAQSSGEPGAGEGGHSPSYVDPVPYDLPRVIERALTYNMFVQMAQVQQAAAEQQMIEQQAPLKPSLTAEVRPTWFETPVPDFSAIEDIDVGKLVDAWDEDDTAEFRNELERQLEGLADEFEDGIPQTLAQGRGYTLSLTGNVSLWRSPLQQAIGQVAELQRYHADVDVESAAAGAIMQSMDAYFGVLRAEQALAIAKLGEEEVQVRSRETKAKVDEGTATRIDLLQVEAELYGAQAQVVQARGELSVAKMTLNSVLGLDLNVPLQLQPLTGTAASRSGTSVAPTDGVLHINEALKLAAKRDDVQKALTDWRLAKAATTIAVEQSKPGLRLFGTHSWPEAEVTVGIDRHGYLGGSISHTETYLDGEQVKGDPANWAAGIELSWPLLDGGERRAKAEQARLQEEQAKLYYEHVRQTSQTEVLAAHARLDAAREALIGARQGIEAATEAVRVAERLAAAGVATDSAVVQARLTLARAEQGYLDAQYGATMAETAFMEASGVLVDHWLARLAR